MAEDRLEKAIAGQTNPEFAAVMVEDLEKNYEQLKTTAKIRECLAEVIENNPKSALLLVNIVGVKEKMAASGQDSFEHKYLYNQIEDVIQRTLPTILRMADKARTAQDVVMDKIMSQGIMDPMDIPEGSAMMLDDKGYGYALMLVDNESELSPNKSPKEVYFELKEKCAHPKEVQDFLQNVHDSGRAAALAMKLFDENTTVREEAGNAKAAQLCSDFPRIALVAIIQGGEDINSPEKLEKAINRSENVHMGRELDLQYYADTEQYNKPVDGRYETKIKDNIDDRYAQVMRERVTGLSR